MTTTEAHNLGYMIIRASCCEVGLVKNGKGVRTWWAGDFGCTLPTLDHPIIQEAIKIQESYENSRH